MKLLDLMFSRRQRSRFVAEAAVLALEIKKKELEKAYKEAAADRERIKEVEEWTFLDLEG